MKCEQCKKPITATPYFGRSVTKTLYKTKEGKNINEGFCVYFHAGDCHERFEAKLLKNMKSGGQEQ